MIMDIMDELYWAINSRNVDKVKDLIKQNIDVNQPISEDGETALMYAVSCDNFEIVKLLLENKADVNKSSNHGYTALINAAVIGNIKIVKLLLENNAEVDKALYEVNETPLMRAVINAHIEVVKLLLENKAEVNKVSNIGSTPLIIAARHGYFGIVKLLLKNNAEVNKHDSFGYTALMEAASEGHLEIVKVLLNAGSNLLFNLKYSENENILLYKFLIESKQMYNDLRSNDYQGLNTAVNNEMSKIHAFMDDHTENMVLFKFLKDLRPIFDQIIISNYHGLNSLAKLELFRAFSFMHDYHFKFGIFYSEEGINQVKESLEVITSLEELTKTSVTDHLSTDSRQNLKDKINQIKYLLKSKDQYNPIGITIDECKVREFISNAKNAVTAKKTEFTKTIKNCIKVQMPKDDNNDSSLENHTDITKPIEITDLPNEIFAIIFHEVLATNKLTKDEQIDHENTERVLLCATDLLNDITLLMGHINELETILEK
jgi:ankyrin repeat protein